MGRGIVASVSNCANIRRQWHSISETIWEGEIKLPEQKKPKLRDYQQKLLKEAESGLQSPKARLMLQLPTGGGKTVIAGELLDRRLKANPKSAAVWFTHRHELADQTCKMLLEAGVKAESHPQFESRYSDAPRIDNGVAILMDKTVSQRKPTWSKYDENDLLVVDEAHHAAARSWKEAIPKWPGPVLGMTATPWRLSKDERFDSLFRGGLLLGPQVHKLQSEGHLCYARVFAPGPEDTFHGGPLVRHGDYTESGITKANEDRLVWTLGVLLFWKKYAANRQTIIYAVSIDHADNLAEVFVEAGISAKAIHAETAKGERAETVKAFKERTLQALINVAIATEGFDLPDASCVVIARPTMSLSLYLQMVGRGLRPKPEDNEYRDCLILDMAGNAERHGLPEDKRKWSLKARGDAGTGNAPVIRCENCEGISSAARRSCVHCGEPFGKDCQRCGKWRAWKWWEYEAHCGKLHDLVCDLCHYDVHLEPVQTVPGQPPVLGEMHQLLETQINELKERIEELDRLLKDGEARDREFDAHVATLPKKEQPRGIGAISRMFLAWEDQLEIDRNNWQARLNKIESANLDDLEICERIHQDLKKLLGPDPDIPEPDQPDSGLSLTTWVNASDSLRVESLQPPTGLAIPVEQSGSLLIAVAEWLIGQKRISRKNCPIMQGFSAKVRCLINTEPYHLKGAKKSPAGFTSPVRLSNGLYLENAFDDMAVWCEYLLERFGFSFALSQFRVHLADKQDKNSSLSPRLTHLRLNAKELGPFPCGLNRFRLQRGKLSWPMGRAVFWLEWPNG